jgi:hypothetical protein
MKHSDVPPAPGASSSTDAHGPRGEATLPLGTSHIYRKDSRQWKPEANVRCGTSMNFIWSHQPHSDEVHRTHFTIACNFAPACVGQGENGWGKRRAERRSKRSFQSLIVVGQVPKRNYTWWSARRDM